MRTRARCNCNDSTSCHDPDSHYDSRADARDRYRPHRPAIHYCIDCGDVRVGVEGDRCAECEAYVDENKRDEWADRELDREREDV